MRLISILIAGAVIMMSLTACNTTHNTTDPTSTPHLSTMVTNTPEVDSKSTSTSGSSTTVTPTTPQNAIETPTTEETINNGSAKADSYYVEEAIEFYETAIISAVNDDNFAEVEKVLLEGSDFYESQKKLVTDLYNKGTKEELITYEIKNIEENPAKNEYKVYSYEKIKIIKTDQEPEIKEFYWTYYLQLADMEAKIYKLEKWNR